MITQLQAAREGIITEQMKKAAAYEELDPELIRTLLTAGKLVIPCNSGHPPHEIRAIGSSTRVKVNVNIGVSPDRMDLAQELEKLQLAQQLKADAVMDLSIGGNLNFIRQKLLEHCRLPLGTVPAYEAFENAKQQKGAFHKLSTGDLFATIIRQAQIGVDFMTIHAGLNRRTLKTVRQSERTLGIVSRGGALLADWMSANKEENPLFEKFDELLDIAAEYDITLSLGDALRPGCIADATDQAQLEELFVLSELALRAQKKGVQVMIEGPGHVPLDQIAFNIQLQKSICRDAPFYVLGPVVCDIAPGYDHITAAVGASIAALNGADFLCYVTPAEHLRLPTLEDVRQGIIATKIAAFSADLARGKKYALNHNNQMARARFRLDWHGMAELALDKECVLNYRNAAEIKTDRESCSMCGDFCSIKLYRQDKTNQLSKSDEKPLRC